MPHSVLIPITIEIPYGTSKYFSVYITDATNGEANFTNNLYFPSEVNKRKNKLWTFKLTLMALTTTQKTNHVKKGNTVKIFSNNRILLKGIIGKIDNSSSNQTIIEGEAYGSWKLANITQDLKEYTNTATSTIFTDMVNNTESAISVGTNTNFGNVTVRFEYENNLNSIMQLADSIGYDWWESWTFPFNTESMNINTSKGSGSSVYTFTFSGATANVLETICQDDVDSQVNSVKILGYGDGVNQLKSTNWDGTTLRTYLNGALTSSGTTVTVDSTTGFGASDKIKIGEEVITVVSVDSGTQFTVTRGSTDSDGNTTTAYAHEDNMEVFCYYDNSASKYYLNRKNGTNSAQASSSINTYGLIEKTIVNQAIYDQNTLDRIAMNIINDYKNPLQRITVKASDPFDALDNADVGDTVTITDSYAGLDTTKEVIGLAAGQDDGGTPYATFELSERRLTVLDIIEEATTSATKESRYFKGATNIDTVNVIDNLENEASPTANPAPGALDLFFNVPDDAVAINSVKLSYRLQAPKTWSVYGSTGVVTNVDAAIPATDITAQTWTDVSAGGYTPGGNTLEFYVQFNVSFSAIAAPGTMMVKARINNVTDNEYYPDSNGIYLGFALATSHLLGGFISCPKNLNGKTIKLELKTSVDATTDACGSQNYFGIGIPSTSYDLINHTYSATDIRVFTSDDASAAPTWTERTAAIEAIEGTLANTENSTEIDISLTDYFTGTGWKGIRIVANGNARCHASATYKCFIDSKVV